MKRASARMSAINVSIYAGLTLWLALSTASEPVSGSPAASSLPATAGVRGIPLQPAISSVGQTYRIVTHDAVRFPCLPVDADPARVVWRRGTHVLTAGNVKISPDERLQLVDEKPPILDLELKDVQTTDAGDYVCQLGTIPPIEVVHTLEVLVPSVIQYVTSDGNVQVNRDATVTLECRGSGNPVPRITWTRKNSHLPNGDKTQEGSTLSIPKVNRHHAGVYHCTAFNDVRQPATQDVHLTVFYAPEIIVELPLVHSGEEREAELVCNVYADPTAEVVWLRDTLKLDTTDRRRMYHRGNRYSLLISNVQVSDFGNYSCAAENALGKARNYLELSGKPGPVFIQSNSLSRHIKEHNITWESKSYTPVEQYVLFYRKVLPNEESVPQYQLPDDYSSRNNGRIFQEGHSQQQTQQSWPSREDNSWSDVKILAPLTRPSTMVSDPGNAPIFTQSMWYVIRNLAEDTTYEVQLLAKNRFGWGPSSEAFRFNTSSGTENQKNGDDDDNMARDLKVIQHNGHSSTRVPLSGFCIAMVVMMVSAWSI